MKKMIFSLMLLAGLVWFFGCSASQPSKPGGTVTTVETKAYWDFYGYAPIMYKQGESYQLALLKAKDVAINEAYTLAVKTLVGFTIKGGSTVEDYMLTKKISRESFNAFVRGMRVLEWYEDREKLMVIAVVRVYKRDLENFLGVPVVTPPGSFKP